MRSPNEILVRLRKIEASDFLDAQSEILILALPFQDAKNFLEDGITEEQWDKDRPNYADEAFCKKLIREAHDIVDQAFQVDNRVAVMRGLCRIRSLVWLLKDNIVLQQFDQREFVEDKLIIIKLFYCDDQTTPNPEVKPVS